MLHGLKLAGLEDATASQHAPCDACELVGERDRKHVAVQPLLGRLDPTLKPMTLPALWLDQHHPGSLHEQNAQIAIAALGYLAENGAVASRDLLGHKTSQAAKSRPFENASPVPIAATIALEMIGPMPGTLTNRSQPASCRARAVISPDKQSIRSSSRRQSSANPPMMRTMRGDSTSGGAARMRGNSARKNRNPCRIATPRSSRKARIWLMIPVRWLTNRSRTRCSACRSSCSAVFVATNFIVGRCTASAIASASRKSFFCPFEYGRTYFAGISRASWPSVLSLRLR